VDRILVDIMSVLRDVLMCQVGAAVELVNQRHARDIEQRALDVTPQTTLDALAALSTARDRMAQNSPPLLVLESFLIVLSGRLATSDVS
jgi:DNA polymerase-3 subunit delta'